MGEMIYAPYDITGAKFLWWTWHDTGIFNNTLDFVHISDFMSLASFPIST